MTAKDIVLDLLQKQKSNAEHGKALDPKARRREWIVALESLMSQIDGWLTDSQQQGLLRVVPHAVVIEEGALGNYTAPALKIVLPQGGLITIKPHALEVAGANGRVDIERPPRKEILVRHGASDWSVAEMMTDHAGWSFEPLDEASFWEVLRRLLD